MAQSPYAPLEGKQVTIAGLTGTFRSCGHCGGVSATVSLKASGTHLGSLTCEGCGHVTAWLGRDHLAAMLATHDSEKRGAA